MSSPNSPAPDAAIHWLFTGRGRLSCALLSGALGALATFRLPPEMRTIISFDVASLVYLALLYVLMSRSVTERSTPLSGRDEIRGAATVIAVVILSIVSVIAVVALLNNLAHAPHWLNVIHLTTSLLAIVLSWLLAHVIFGLHYMALFYDDGTTGGDSGHDRGLEFLNRPQPGYWDFMYYSFTIGMCFGTSDVAVTNTIMRRATLHHAIFSFFFVAAIVGFVVNILSSLA